MEINESHITMLWDVRDLQKKYGMLDYSDSIEILYRVLKTREALRGKAVDAVDIYKTMQSVTAASVKRFPGDADLFNKFYQTLYKIDAHAILYYVAQISGGRDLIVPGVLSRKFMEHITKNVHSVLIAECEKYGSTLLDTIIAHPETRFVFTCKLDLHREILSLIYADYSNVSLISADIYSYEFTDEKFDLIVAVPVFGGRMLVEGEDFISREPGMIAVQNLLYHINMDGELVIILPAKITFASGSVANLREYIENNYKIKEISILPAGLFVPYTSIKTYLFSISTGRTEDVVLRRYAADKPLRRNSVCSDLVLTDEELLFGDEFNELNGWNIDIAFSDKDNEVKVFSDSPVKKIILKDTATVFRGKAIKCKSEKGSIGVINISNMTDTGVDYSGLDRIEDEERKISRYILEDGDVLVTSRGTTIKVAVFQKQPTLCIPSANINVIRPKGNLRGTYLKLFLESPVGNKMLMSLQRGTGVVNINYKDLNDLEVPILAIEKQDAIINEYYTGLESYKHTIDSAEVAWNRIQNEIQAKLY